ncbi:MAG TPA: NUDIX hydrolase [Mucilaginibacter sp.]|nr:NUDIX hydrolase [Mucilaginibacter sp.]
MDNLEELQHFFSQGYLDYRPCLSVDCAIFGYHNNDLQVLLTKSLGVTMWCLPAGYVKKEESLEQAATRITEDRTGMENLFLKHFKAFWRSGKK